MRDFRNSTLKEEGTNKVFLLKHSSQAHTLHLVYEHTNTSTTPKVPKDLEVKKFASRYTYSINNKSSLHAGYLNIDDNLVSTDGGKIYTIGMSHKPSQKSKVTLATYYGNYDIMKTYQFDATISYTDKLTLFDTKVKSTSALLSKYINITECQQGEICSNAQSNYFTPGFSQKFSYQGNYLSLGALFGKRAFSVMQEGLKVQHHGMEFYKTAKATIGKKFGIDNKSTINCALSYIYQEATELPSQNSNVEVHNTVLTLGYKF
jgi:hypothetical protein